MSNDAIAPAGTSATGPSLLTGPDVYAGALTAEGLMMYTAARMQNMDLQISDIFERQTKADAVRKSLRMISTELSRLDERQDNPTEPAALPAGDIHTNIENQLKALHELDPRLEERVRNGLSGENGLLIQMADGKYTGVAVVAAKELVGNINKDLDASAQMEMIKLQQLTSARQTAISLATNMLASVSDALKAVVANYK